MRKSVKHPMRACLFFFLYQSVLALSGIPGNVFFFFSYFVFYFWCVYSSNVALCDNIHIQTNGCGRDRNIRLDTRNKRPFRSFGMRRCSSRQRTPQVPQKRTRRFIVIPPWGHFPSTASSKVINPSNRSPLEIRAGGFNKRTWRRRSSVHAVRARTNFLTAFSVLPLLLARTPARETNAACSAAPPCTAERAR